MSDDLGFGILWDIIRGVLIVGGFMFLLMWMAHCSGRNKGYEEGKAECEKEFVEYVKKSEK